MRFDLQREARQGGQTRQRLWRQRERHQRRPRRDHRNAELLGDAITERGGADLRDRQSTGGDHQARGAKVSAVGLDREAFALGLAAMMANLMHGGRHRPLHAAVLAFGAQHVDDLLRGIVAEELAPIPFVEIDAVSLHKLDKIARRAARQRRAHEMRIEAEIVLGADPPIGEVAAAPAGDADLLGKPGGVIHQQHAASALAGGGGAHHAGGAGADDHDIEMTADRRCGRREGVHHVLTCTGKAAQNTPYAAMRQSAGLYDSLCASAGVG